MYMYQAGIYFSEQYHIKGEYGKKFCFRCKMQYKVHIEQNISGVIFFFLSKLTQYTLIVSVEYITLRIQNNKHFILMQLLYQII